MIKYFDDEGNEVEAQDATSAADIQTDEDGKIVSSRLFVVEKEQEEAGHSFSHNSEVESDEPDWGDVVKTELPDDAFADEDARSYPHHWVEGGDIEDGRFVSGTMYLHRGGLGTATAAARGARSGKQASEHVKAHLQKHRDALGLEEVGRRVRGTRIAQVNTLIDAAQALIDGLQDFITWAAYADELPENFHVDNEEARHARDKCMDCDESPAIEVLWAEGKAHAWFCASCYGKWIKDDHDDDVNYEKEIEYGIARMKFSDRNSPQSVDEVEPKEGEDKDAFIERCIPFIIEQEGKDRRQAIAMCYSMWDDGKKD